ncbi:MAG: glycerol-3-phosphate responsive antiterminator [Oscillospiraceae bacterium]
MYSKSLTIFQACPIIAAAKNSEHLKICLSSPCEVIFLLGGELASISELIDTAKDAGKFVVVHIDLISGLSNKESAVDFIKKYTRADGIISTRPQTIKHANDLGLFTVLRLFLLDSMALDNLGKQVNSSKPDMIEVLPGLMPRIIEKICTLTTVPLIAGGLISEKGDVVSALSAGATCISTTKSELWSL